MTISYDELNAKNRGLSLMCIMGGLVYGFILATLIIGNLFAMCPSILLAVFTGVGWYIMWAVCIVIAVLLTCIIVHYIKKVNKTIKDFKNENNL